MRTLSFLILAALLLVPVQAIHAGPFDSETTVKIAPSQSKTLSLSGQTEFEKNLEQFERNITTGIKKVGTALDKNDVNTSGNGTISIVPGETSGIPTAQAPQGAQSSGQSASTTGANVGATFKELLQKIGDMFKAIVQWGKAFWNKITGPTLEEAPITHTVNEVKSSLATHNVKSTAKDAGQAAIGFFSSIGNFFKSLFN